MDARSAGILGCLTPKGIPFSTVRGGMINGIECLSLQGIPIDRLSLIRETQENLQDLAGNAMSTPVVGTAILSILLCGLRFLPKSVRTSKSQASKALEVASYHCNIIETNKLVLASNSDVPKTITKAVLSERLSKGIRMCDCESPTTIASAPIQQCVVCKHSSCTSCGVEQRHEYEIIDHVRSNPATLVEDFKKFLPVKMTLPVDDFKMLDMIRDDKVKNQGKKQKTPQLMFKQGLKFSSKEKLQSEKTADWDVWRHTVERALRSEFRFQTVKRSRIWTATYRAAHARMLLVIAPGQFEWQLFAELDADRPGNDPLRAVLLNPIARMIPDASNILSGSWQIWNPSKQSFAIEIKPSGEFVRTWKNQLGIIDHLDTYNRENYTLTSQANIKYLDVDICGVYKLLQCHSIVAERSLHVKVDTVDSTTPLYLFLDPTRFGDPAKDTFVFSKDIHRLSKGEKRLKLAYINHTWRQPIYERVYNPDQPGQYLYKPKGSSQKATENPESVAEKAIVELEGHWIDLPETQLNVASESQITKVYQPADNFVISPSNKSCQLSHLVLRCCGKLPQDETSEWKKGKKITVKDVDQKDFFQEFAWLLQKNSKLDSLAKWSVTSSFIDSQCASCAPTAPPIKWTMSDDKQQSLKPFEDARLAGPFEAAVKNRPAPFTINVQTSDTGMVEIEVGFNPETLVHRAMAILASSQDASTDWRLVTGYVNPSMPDLFAFTLRDNKSDILAMQPKDFVIKDCLRPEQLRSLGWQIRQETEPVAFVEEEVAEVYMPLIGWRGEGRAAKLVTIRGGVLAHEVGYGKTVTTLALISAQRLHDAEQAKNDVPGRICVKATLILVPNQLRKQWIGETQKFLKSGYKVLEIATIDHLAKMSIAQIQDADIIIANWKIFESDKYTFLVAQFAGLVELPDKAKSRAQSAWYEAAREMIAINVEELKLGGRSLHAKIKQDFADQVELAKQVETFIPSKRLTGQSYQNHKTAMTTMKFSKSSEKTGSTKTLPRLDPFKLVNLVHPRADWRNCKQPLLEFFQFSRIVVDEFVYAQGKEAAIISNLSSGARWILSATPPMKDFSDIKRMAGMIGINLGVDNASPEALEDYNVKAIEAEQTGKLMIDRSYLC